MKLSNALGSAFDGSTRVFLACMWQLQQWPNIPSSQGCLQSWMEEMPDEEQWMRSEESGTTPKRCNQSSKWRAATHTVEQGSDDKALWNTEPLALWTKPRHLLVPIYPSDIISLSHHSCCPPARGYGCSKNKPPHQGMQKGTGWRWLSRLSSSSPLKHLENIFVISLLK